MHGIGGGGGGGVAVKEISPCRSFFYIFTMSSGGCSISNRYEIWARGKSLLMSFLELVAFFFSLT